MKCHARFHEEACPTRERVIVCLLRNTTDGIPNEARTLKGLQTEAAMREGCNYTCPRRLFFDKDRIWIDVRFVETSLIP